MVLTLIVNLVFEAAYRISHADMMSTPRPTTMPCTAAITGNRHRSGAVMASWNGLICFLKSNAIRAASVDSGSASAVALAISPASSTVKSVE